MKSTHASKLNLETVASVAETRRTMRLPTEKKKLSLEEFYAPTPVPEVFPAEVRRLSARTVRGNAYARSARQKGVIKEVSVERKEDDVDFEDGAQIADETSLKVLSELEEAEIDLMIAHEEGVDEFQSSSPLRPQGRHESTNSRKERKTPWGEFADHPREPRSEVEANEPTPTTRQQHPQRQLNRPPIQRSRTMPVHRQQYQQQRREIRPVPVSSSSNIASHDWSESDVTMEQQEERSRFTIDKHVAMKRRAKQTRSNSTTNPLRQTKKIAQVSLKGSAAMGDSHKVGSKSKSADHPPHQRVTQQHRPKLIKSHSFYANSGINQSQQGSGDSIASLVSSIKLGTGTKSSPSASAAVMASSSPKAIRQSAWETNPSNELIPLTRTRGATSNTRKPVYSSASSWRKRPSEKSEKGSLKALGPIRNSAPATGGAVQKGD